MSELKRKRAVRLILALVIVFVGCAASLSAICYMKKRSRVQASREERIETHAEMRWAELSLKRQLRDMERLPDLRRAQEIWRVWLVLCDDQRWVWRHFAEELLLPELVGLGDVAMEVILQDVRDAPNLGSDEAPEWLRSFGPAATYRVIEILETGSAQTQHAALSALWYMSVADPSEEERSAIRGAVSPFLDDSDEGKRAGARMILEDLED